MLALLEPDDGEVDGFEEPLSLLVPLDDDVLEDESDLVSDFDSDFDSDDDVLLLLLVGPLALALEARESLMYQPLPLNTMPTG